MVICQLCGPATSPLGKELPVLTELVTEWVDPKTDLEPLEKRKNLSLRYILI
jgi:hypothetical protein